MPTSFYLVRDVLKTYCQTQREKPLKVCRKCQKPWYMDDDLCMDCEDKYAARRAKTVYVEDAEPVNDTQGNYMGGYGE
jgi:predicted amidophosphoribosyltransferase